MMCKYMPNYVSSIYRYKKKTEQAFKYTCSVYMS